ncbi:Uncharacterised protein [Legionella oakridgensis]|nr:hypothetical protein LLB_2339 [Legionella longbeachae D-4968]VEE03918.1 Uncharacterised protein [Legionella oakridgensis]
MIIALALLKILIMPAFLKLIKNYRNPKKDNYIQKEARPQTINI